MLVFKLCFILTCLERKPLPFSINSRQSRCQLRRGFTFHRRGLIDNRKLEGFRYKVLQTRLHAATATAGPDFQAQILPQEVFVILCKVLTKK